MINQLNYFFKNSYRHRKFKIILLFSSLLIFLYSRITVLNAELSTEEWLFLSPGINLISQNFFLYDWGILAPDGNPFHKPPLTSIVYGFFSYFFNDQIYSAKFFSFLINFIGLILLYKITKNILIILFYIFSYFFLASSIIIQTDILVFFGFIILSIAQLYYKKKSINYILLLFIGFLILWMTKIESALIILFCYSLYYVLIKEIKNFFYLYLINIICIFLTLILIFLLTNYTNNSFMDNLFSIFYPIERILGHQTESLVFNFKGYLYSLVLIFIKLYQYGFILETVTIFGIVFYILTRQKYLFNKDIIFFLILFILPFTIYFFVGYAGMQFPRYFIFSFYSLIILFSLITNKISKFKNIRIINLLILFLIIFNFKNSYFLLKNKGNLYPGEIGKKEIGVYLEEKGIKGDLVTYEYFSGYIKNKRYLWTIIKGYEVNKKKVIDNLHNIEGIIIKKNDYVNYDVAQILNIFQNNYNLKKIEFKNYDLWIKKI